MLRIIDGTQKFIKEVKSEMSKVTWPTWVELKGSTILVVMVSAFFAVYIGVVDFILTFARRLF